MDIPLSPNSFCPALRWSRLHPNAVAPRHTPFGFELCCVERALIPFGLPFRVRTGIALEVPSGYVGALVILAHLGIKEHLRIGNGATLLTTPFPSEIVVPVQSDAQAQVDCFVSARRADLFTFPFHELRPGAPFAHLVFLPVPPFPLEEVPTPFPVSPL